MPASYRSSYFGARVMVANEAMAAKSAIAGATALTLDSVSWAMFGVAPAVWAGSFSGALFGATWFHADSRVAKPWAVLTNTLAGVFLSALAAAHFTMGVTTHSGIGFLIACGPVLVIRALRSRLLQNAHGTKQ